MIVKKGTRYQVRTHDGAKLLGSHATEKRAVAQLRAIEASKARRARGAKA